MLPTMAPGAQRGEQLAGLPAHLAESDDGDPPSRELPGGVPLPGARGLPPGKLGQLLHEIQDAGERELRERNRVHAGRGGERDGAVAEACPLHELPDPRAGGLHPAQPGTVARHAGRVKPVEVEADVGGGAHRPPPLEVGLRQVPGRSVVVGGVPGGREQFGGVEHLDGRIDRRDPRHVLRLEGRTEEDLDRAVGSSGHGYATPRSSPSALSTATMRPSASSHCASSLAKHTRKWPTPARPNWYPGLTTTFASCWSLAATP